MEVVLMKGKRDVMRPLFLKLGTALLITCSGFLYSFFRARRICSGPPKSVGGTDGGVGRLRVEDGIGEKQSEEMSQSSQIAVDRNSIWFLPAGTNDNHENTLLLPEVSELMQKRIEQNAFSGRGDSRDVVTPNTRDAELVEFKMHDEEARAREEEVTNLRNMVQELQDRARNLEAQLFRYYGLAEQDSLVHELQNRLNINATEVQLFKVKIESLQAENKRLEAQLSGYPKVKSELEMAKGMIKQLHSKIKSDAQQTKEQLSALHQKVTALHDQEHKSATDDAIQKKLQSLKDLEEELVDVKRVNARLKDENSELYLKLESTKLVASDLENAKAQAVEEAKQLRQAKDDVEKEIERLQTDRCTDIEELVYLRWVNACLRYELRNYQPATGKTVARDLNKSMSPKSEEKAKQLILEYANLGFDVSGLGPMDFESLSDCCSSSPASTLTESEVDGASTDLSSFTKDSTSNKLKTLNKLKRLVLGKSNHHKSIKISSVDKTPTCSTTSMASSDETAQTCLHKNISLGAKVERAISDLSAVRVKPFYDSSIMAVPSEEIEPGIERQQSKTSLGRKTGNLSLDVKRLRKLSLEEFRKIGSNKEQYGCEKTVLGEGGVMELIHDDHHLNSDPEKLELKKYAQVLHGSRLNQNVHCKSASFASF